MRLPCGYFELEPNVVYGGGSRRGRGTRPGDEASRVVMLALYCRCWLVLVIVSRWSLCRDVVVLVGARVIMRLRGRTCVGGWNEVRLDAGGRADAGLCIGSCDDRVIQCSLVIAKLDMPLIK